MRTFELKEYSEISRHSPVMNVNDIDYFWSLHIPESVALTWQLFEIKQILPDDGIALDDFPDYTVRCGMRPWIDVKTEWLDTAPGKHIYKLSFVHVITGETFNRYFTYTVQQDNPDQPYVYMKRSDDNAED